VVRPRVKFNDDLNNEGGKDAPQSYMRVEEQRLRSLG
jgi:hypothetical protein